MKNTGQILKDKRESLNLTISEVALSTKINPKILAAMEAGDQKALPAQTFLKGFVRSYASYLKLDQEELIRSFNQETGAARAEKAAAEAPKVEVPVKTERERPRVGESEVSPLMKSAAVAAIVVLIGVIFGIRELIQKYQKETVVEQPKDLKATPIPEDPESTAEGEAPAADEPVIQSTPEAIAALATPKIPDEIPVLHLKTEPPEAEAKPVEAKPEVKPEPVVETKPDVKVEAPDVAKVDPKAELKAEPKLEVAAPSGAVRSEIILEALDNVDVKIGIKGQTKKLSLAPTQVHTVRTDGPVQFDFSDGGAINIIVNGRERGVPGDLGKPKQVQIP